MKTEERGGGKRGGGRRGSKKDKKRGKSGTEHREGFNSGSQDEGK